VEELKKAIQKYFKSCWQPKLDMYGKQIFLKDKTDKKTKKPVMVQFKPYTITGLAVALRTTRQTLLEYEGEVEGRAKSDPEFADTIKRAKEMCHSYAEESLFIGKNPTGAIFNLKNNYGWRDKTEVEHKVPGGLFDVKISVVRPTAQKKKKNANKLAANKKTK
jgi:hypothetical protein